MDTLVPSYSIGMPSALQAIASSGRTIKIYADDAVNLQTLRAGSEVLDLQHPARDVTPPWRRRAPR